MKYWFVMLMIAMSLMGCATTKTETVTVVKNIYVEVPSELVERCTVTAPPRVAEYESLSPITKEYVLTMYATNLLQDIAVCSQQIVKIQQWNKEQSAIFNKPPKSLEVENAKQSQPPEPVQ